MPLMKGALPQVLCSSKIVSGVEFKKGALFKALLYMIYISEKYFFSLVCTFKKVDNFLE